MTKIRIYPKKYAIIENKQGKEMRIVTLEFVDNYLNEKLRQEEERIKLTFYEVRVKLNLEEEDAILFLKLIAQKLVNIGYHVYAPKQEYSYQGQKEMVKDNELLVGIKQET